MWLNLFNKSLWIFHSTYVCYDFWNFEKFDLVIRHLFVSIACDKFHFCEVLLMRIDWMGEVLLCGG